MNEEKRNVAKLDQEKMEDVKGGIPYDEPALIPLDEPVVVDPGDPGDPGGVIVVGTGSNCESGYSNLGGSCVEGNSNRDGSCMSGDSNRNGVCGPGQGVLFP